VAAGLPVDGGGTRRYVVIGLLAAGLGYRRWQLAVPLLDRRPVGVCGLICDAYGLPGRDSLLDAILWWQDVLAHRTTDHS
jgi:hypothetical protein